MIRRAGFLSGILRGQLSILSEYEREHRLFEPRMQCYIKDLCHVVRHKSIERCLIKFENVGREIDVDNGIGETRMVRVRSAFPLKSNDFQPDDFTSCTLLPHRRLQTLMQVKN
jgi:hypothetical protein